MLLSLSINLKQHNNQHKHNIWYLLKKAFPMIFPKRKICDLVFGRVFSYIIKHEYWSFCFPVCTLVSLNPVCTFFFDNYNTLDYLLFLSFFLSLSGWGFGIILSCCFLEALNGVCLTSLTNVVWHMFWDIGFSWDSKYDMSKSWKFWSSMSLD